MSEQNGKQTRERNLELARVLSAVLCACAALCSLVFLVISALERSEARSLIQTLDIEQLENMSDEEFLLISRTASVQAPATFAVFALVAAATGFYHAMVSLKKNIAQSKLFGWLPCLGFCGAAVCPLISLDGGFVGAMKIGAACCFFCCALMLLPFDLSAGGKLEFGFGSKIDLKEGSAFRAVLAGYISTAAFLCACLSSYAYTGARFIAVMLGCAAMSASAWTLCYAVKGQT